MTLSVSSTRVNKNSTKTAIFDFQSISVQEETFRDTNTTTWYGKHVPISVSISSNLVEEPIFLCNSHPHQLVAPFIKALENLASQNKEKMKNLFPDIETTTRIKLGSILEQLTQGYNRRESARFDMSQNDCDKEICASTQFLQLQKKSFMWSSRISGTLLQRFTCVWFQQCKIRSQLNQILFATHSC